MKYGDTLHQRSIPEWEAYNVDYNDIKRLIKVRTTKGQGQPQAIPGNDYEAKALRNFENELYAELEEQYQRIDLFVRSKSGETSRRLVDLDKKLARLETKSFHGSNTKMSVRRLERFAKLEDETLKVGEEVQRLSRFVGSQRVAFQKLLKKYRRWTGSVILGKRFRRDVLEHDSSFVKRDFEYLLSQWTIILAAVRAPFNDVSNTLPTNMDPNTARPKRSAGILHEAGQGGPTIDLDTALAITPLGKGATKASYWVHADNIMQIQIVLLNHARLRTIADSTSTPPSPTSSRSSRRGSLIERSPLSPLTSTIRTDDGLGLIVCDDLQRFAQRRSSETIGEAEDLPGSADEKAAATIRYSSTGAAVVAVDVGAQAVGRVQEVGQTGRYREAKFKRKAVRQLFEQSDTDRGAMVGNSSTDGLIRQRLADHPEIKPLVQLQYSRTRFVGLENTKQQGVWVTLDRDVSMRTCSLEAVSCDNGLFNLSHPESSGFEKFPHAILEVRTEGNDSTNLVKTLDESYLAERIRGFSLETHAVATLCKPQGMPRPIWFPVLNTDIRKVPPSAASTARVPKKKSSPEQASTRHTSISISASNGPSSGAFSAVRGESSVTSAPEILGSPPLSAFKKKKKFVERRQSKRRKYPEVSQRGGGYWNEFDDGSEGAEDEAYTIFVDPNARSTFPGAAAISTLFTSIATKASATTEKIHSWLSKPINPLPDPERQLLSNDFPRSPDNESDPSDEESRTSTPTQRRYSSFPNLFPEQDKAVQPSPPFNRARETLLFTACIASFAVSIVFLVITALLLLTSRKKAATTADAGVVVGVAASLVFAVVGVGSVAAGQRDVGWLYRTAIILISLAVLAGNVGVIVAVGQAV